MLTSRILSSLSYKIKKNVDLRVPLNQGFVIPVIHQNLKFLPNKNLPEKIHIFLLLYPRFFISFSRRAAEINTENFFFNHEFTTLYHV